MSEFASPTQLSLGVTLRDDATFESFYAGGDANEQAVEALRALSSGIERSSHVVWGSPGCGLSHLLQAVCHEAQSLGRSVQYLPMRDILGYAAGDICEGLEEAHIVCVDGIDLICGNRDWEVALFHLYNRLRDSGNAMLIASHSSPPLLPIVLKDLKSRVLGSIVYHVKSLDDDCKVEALMKRAQMRGISMAEDVAKFIVSRTSRDMNNLFMVLNQLDEASLQHQRKLTIPFVKETLRI